VDLIRVARNLSTGAVTMIAAWSSWSHMVHVALRFGERPEVAYVLPISVDGMLVVASTAMVEDKRAGRNVRWSARVAFGAGVAASVAANIAAAHPTPGARIVAAWPALAMLLVVEILSRGQPPSLTGDAAAQTGGPSADRDVGAGDRAVVGGSAAVARNTEPAGDTSLAPNPPQRTTSAGHRRRPERRTADAVRRLRADHPDVSLADIAAQVGVSERHVRRVLTSLSDEPRDRSTMAVTPRPVADT